MKTVDRMRPKPVAPCAISLRLAFSFSLALALSIGCAGQGGVPANMRSWNRDFPPYHVIGNIYYVGSNDVAQFLITTSDGHILLDSGFEASVPRLRDNVQALGFKFEDIKVLLTSHAHIDHVQGHALVRKLTGARVVASVGDTPFVAAGGKGEPVFDGVHSWTPCPVDQMVSDGEAITLGDTMLVAHVTPGHTMGATTWTMKVDGGRGRLLDVVFFPSANINPGVHLVGNARYPAIAEDFARSFSTWRGLPCDVFLGVHGDFFGMAKKKERLAKGGDNPFIDPAGYRKFVEAAETRFRSQLAEER